jgi:hypothetical protein
MESKLVIILDADALYMLSLDEACQGCLVISFVKIDQLLIVT